MRQAAVQAASRDCQFWDGEFARLAAGGNGTRTPGPDHKSALQANDRGGRRSGTCRIGWDGEFESRFLQRRVRTNFQYLGCLILAISIAEAGQACPGQGRAHRRQQPDQCDGLTRLLRCREPPAARRAAVADQRHERDGDHHDDTGAEHPARRAVVHEKAEHQRPDHAADAICNCRADRQLPVACPGREMGILPPVVAGRRRARALDPSATAADRTIVRGSGCEP